MPTRQQMTPWKSFASAISSIVILSAMAVADHYSVNHFDFAIGAVVGIVTASVYFVISSIANTH